MSEKAFLVLEDGSTYEGEAFGADTGAGGEVVFDTAMAGYQEALTDPSFAGQILVMTYPLVGNYGINRFDVESNRIHVNGLVVREHCDIPSHWQSEMTLHEYLSRNGIPGLSGVDTRALTRRLRISGVMMGLITRGEDPDEALAHLRETPRYGETDFVRQVSTDCTYEWPDSSTVAKHHIVLIDLGVKYNIMRLLSQKGAHVTVVPYRTSAEDVLALRPDGVVLSPGPGDPVHLGHVVETVKGLAGRIPMLGICIGHQALATAFGASNFKMKFGHHGANHPVRDLATGRVHITAQNHGYAVDPDGLRDGMEVSLVNLNDDTVEGLRHDALAIMSIQYHSEASPGPLDNTYFFDRFLDLVSEWKGP
ncbi:MAG TPA: glutamine-hydrolyzing carbamoyl-phosphate synthase small subunit [Dehalococcoidia bacterium]|nr:glutamine-hydrolyzing carbamoyl-phosphate synthase small subunit [Dehalococcoidia bacterium]